MKNQSLKLIPITTPGKSSVWLAGAMLALFAAGSSTANTLYASSAAGSTIMADITARPVLALSMLAGMLAGLLALITGLLAIFKQKDHALLVYASSIIGALLAVLLLGEITVPH